MKSLLPIVAGLAVSVSSFAMAGEPTAKVVAPDGAKPDEAKKAAPVEDLKTPTLYVVGYAHLDTQWRWTYQDTIREYIPRTLNDNFKLFEKYPDYVFNFSGSRRYQMMKEYYPEQYEKLKGYVKAGKWFPCGSSVDENDANVPSAESFVRQVMYGNKYFRKEFGVASDEFMLPDCFGFPASMPTMLAHCGIKGFSTQKLTWGLAIGKPPFKVGFWEGTDGRGVTAALDPGSYVGTVTENLANSNMWEQRIKATAAKSGVHVDYHYYGTGDTGGAPEDASVKMVQESANTKGKIKVLSQRADAMFNAITPEMQGKLEKYKGELMLTEHSSGAITSQAYMKRWNRKNELLADAAEKASVGAWWMGGRPYPGQKLEDAWYLVLGSQMHDILPGTSVPKAYDFSWNDEVLAANQFGSVLIDAAGAIAAELDTQASGTSIVVYNPLSWARQDVVEVEIGATAGAKGVKVIGPDGKPVAAQVLGVEGGVAKVAFAASVPSVGFASYDVQLTNEAPAKSGALSVSERQLENELYTVKLNDNGDVASIFDKGAKRELLSAPVRLGLHHENPREWPAWNQDWADRKMPAKAFVGGPATFKVIENGPARVAVEVTRETEGSTFVQRIRLGAGVARVEFENDINWQSRVRSLRAHFPLTVSNPMATYNLAAGTIQRGNGNEHLFEYNFHHWFDLTDAKGDYGVTAMCDSKFGTDKPDDNTIRLTLLHTPGTRGGYPDQGTQDIGRHHITYALYGHSGPWQKGQGPAEAARLNSPLLAFAAPAHPGSMGKSVSLMGTSSPAVSIAAAKKAEEGDEVIIRLREHTGESAKGVKVTMARPIISAREVDGQERPIGSATVTGGELVTDLHGYDLKAFAVKLGEAPAKVAKIESTPVALKFDTDVITTRKGLTDGAMDDKGNTYPAEMIPAMATIEGVNFTFGSSAEGQKNAVTCAGQEIAVPAGSSRVVLLAAATSDVDSTISVDGKSMPWGVQSWTGYIGQWDRRVFPNETGNGDGEMMIGLEPGYIKDDSVAWFSSHFHTKAGNSIYEFCYIYSYPVDLPAGAKSIKLPNEAKIKVLAATFTKGGGAAVKPARPVFDTLKSHQYDAPRVVAGAGPFTDATDVRIEPSLYGRPTAIRYTIDGTEPTMKSAVYGGPVTISATTTFKAAITLPGGKLSPVVMGKVAVDDKIAPSVKRVAAAFQAVAMTVEFSEPVADSATDVSHFRIEPTIEVKKVELAKDRRSATVTLAKPPEPKQAYRLNVAGIKDMSPAGNESKAASFEFAVGLPVYSLAAVTPAEMGKTIKEVPGLPVKAGDKWSINMSVKMAQQPQNRTVIAGFGLCEDRQGQGRYLTKFGNGIQFWSSNRDVPTTTQFELNKWQMVTMTYDGDTVRVYRDGKKIAEGKQTFADDAAVINIAPKDPWERMRTFEGEIREFTIWNSALNDEGIASLLKAAPK